MGDQSKPEASGEPWISEDEALQYAKELIEREKAEAAVTVDKPASVDLQSEGSLSSEIRGHIRFRLFGYGLDGRHIPWDKDIQNIQGLENQLVIDPYELQDLFDTIRKPEKDHDDEKKIARLRDKYERGGFHAYPLEADSLYRVRREGIIMYAGIQNAEGVFHPVAYNYGLDSMPEDDQEFESLSLDTLGMASDEKKEVDRSKIYMNWRTGVLDKVNAKMLRDLGVDVPRPHEDEEDMVSMRRLGIASAMKYLFMVLAERRRKMKIMFNIGTIEDWKNPKEKLRNTASYEHNRRIFAEDLMYRKRPYHVIMRGQRGQRERIAKIRWRARGDELDDAKASLLQSDSSLISKEWDPHVLEELVDKQFMDQLRKDKNRGDRDHI